MRSGAFVSPDPNLFDRDQRAAVHARAWCVLFRRFPCSLRCQQFRPEWPCAALRWSRLVYSAQRSAGLRAAVEEDAVETVLRLLFTKRRLPGNGSHIPRAELLVGQTKHARHRSPFFWAEPHDARRPGTAVSALRAFEAQAICVPLVRRWSVRLRFLLRHSVGSRSKHEAYHGS